MLTVLVGTNSKGRKTRLETLLAPLQKQGADIRVYSDVNFSSVELEANAGSSSLFGTSIISVVSGIGDSASLRDEFEKLLPVLREDK